MRDVQAILDTLERSIRTGVFENVETDWLECKPTPSDHSQWSEIEKSVCAFLNTRGGVLVLGVKEPNRMKIPVYEFTGWRPDAEEKLKSLKMNFLDPDDKILDLTDYVSDLRIQPFLNGQIGLFFVRELAADTKFVRVKSTRKAWKRIGTGDHEIKQDSQDWHQQLNYRDESRSYRELDLIPNTSLQSIDLHSLNQVITKLNEGRTTETLKTSLDDARSYLERKSYMRDGKATILGMLVCGKEPGDILEFRAKADGYIDLPGRTRADKQHFEGHVLDLIEQVYSYVQRSTLVGVDKTVRSGSAISEYPLELLSEMINNAFTHRDYSVNKPVRVIVKPNECLRISNPGRFRDILKKVVGKVPNRYFRIIPENKPTNPKLAGLLRFFDKWEGRSIGMSTLVDMCLTNQIDIPYYQFKSDEVELVLRPGKLVGDMMKQHFECFDGFILSKTRGKRLSDEQMRLLAYLIKSEWENQRDRFTVMLTHDNNHSRELCQLEQDGLIERHPESDDINPVFLVARELVDFGEPTELSEMFGNALGQLDSTNRNILKTVYRINRFSKLRSASAKQVAFALWHESHEPHQQDIVEFDRFYRSIRHRFAQLTKSRFLDKLENKRYIINSTFRNEHLL